MTDNFINEADSYEENLFIGAKGDTNKITVYFIEDIMDFIFYYRERLISGEDVIPPFEDWYKGKVEDQYKGLYDKAVRIGKEYFKVYWKANEIVSETDEDKIFFDEAIEAENGDMILGIGCLEENGVIKYMMTTPEGKPLDEYKALSNVNDIVKVIDQFLQADRKIDKNF